ncbi:autotransporter outer membrane beta-barrel domain-containing protein [Tritonibacter sp. SIMBA_163]|uniref:autotransporter family protein n=1 Tax=Tritonibacter sp. SIMBA_163 TaxID=3080868 RepID=UPI00397FC830
MSVDILVALSFFQFRLTRIGEMHGTCHSRSAVKKATLAFLSGAAWSAMIVTPSVADPLLAGSFWSSVGSFDPRFDSVDIRITGDSRATMEGDIDSFSETFHSAWRTTRIAGPAGANARPVLNLQTLDLSTGFAIDEAEYRFSLENLNLSNVDFRSERVQLFFRGGDNRLSFDNASLRLGTDPLILSTAPMALSFDSGDSTVTNFNTSFAGATSISVRSGASATFELSGSRQSTDPNDALWFRGPTTIDIDGGSLTFDRSHVQVGNGTTTIRNGGRLTATGADSYLILPNVVVEDGSTLAVGSSGSEIVVGSLQLDSGSVNLSSTSRLRVNRLQIEDIGTIIGGTGGGENMSVDLFDTANSDPTVFTLDGVSRLDITSFIGRSNLTVELDESTLVFPERSITIFDGATVNVNAGSTLSFFSQIDNPSLEGTINLAEGGAMFVSQNTDLTLNPLLNLGFAENSVLEVQGQVSGTGDLGEAITQLNTPSRNQFQAAISPGVDRGSRSADQIGEITANGDLSLYGDVYTRDPILASTGLFDGSRYIADISVSGGTPSNDVLAYGDGEVDLSLMEDVYVRVLDQATAAELSGREFTIVRSQDAAAAGGIFLNGQSVDIVVDPFSVPALVGFTVVDRRTNGHDDITLVASTQPVAVLPSLGPTGRNPQSILTSTVGVAGNGTPAGGPYLTNGTSLGTALNSLTPQQLSQFSFLHGEAYSSFLTVGLEHMELVFDMVQRHVSGTVGGLDLSSVAVKEAFRAPDTLIASRFSASDDIAETSGPNTWVDVAYARGDVEGQADLGGFQYDLTGFVAGVDVLADQGRRVGGYFGYGTSELNEHDSIDHELASDVVHLGLYGTWHLESNWQVSAVGGYMFGQNVSTRVANSVGAFTGGVARADFDSYGVYAGVVASRNVALSARTELNLSGGLSYSYLHQDEFREIGATDLNFDVAQAQAEALVASVGVEVEHDIYARNGSFTLLGLARYHYDVFADRNSEHEISFSNPFFGKFVQVGKNRGAQSLTLGLGGTGYINDSTTFGIGLARTWNSHGEENSVDATLAIRW